GPASRIVTTPQPLADNRQGARPGSPRGVASRFIQGYLDSGASQYAGMLAFSLLVSLLPLMLGVLTVFGLLAGSVGHQQRLVVLRHPLVDTFRPPRRTPWAKSCSSRLTISVRWRSYP